MSLLSIIKEIQGIMGIRAVFAQVEGLGVLHAGLPPEFTPPLLDRIEVFLSRCLAAPGLGAVEVVFANTVFFFRPLGDDAMLAVAAEPDVNRALLHLTLKMTADELCRAVAALKADPGRALAAGDGTTGWQPPAGLTPAATEELAAIFSCLRQALGPLASTVMTTCVTDWLGNGGPEEGGTGSLIESLCMEIGDPAIEAAFRRSLPRPQERPNKIMVSPELARRIGTIMDAFCAAVGPVGAVIMKQKLRRWSAVRPAAATRLPELATLLAAEIEDPERRRVFEKTCYDMISG